MAIVIDNGQALSVTKTSAYLRAFYHPPFPLEADNPWVYPGFRIGGVDHYFSTHHYGVWPPYPVDMMRHGGYFGFNLTGLTPDTTYSATPFVVYLTGDLGEEVENWVYGDAIGWTTLAMVDLPEVLAGVDYTDALTLIHQVANASLGRAYVDAEGILCYESRFHRVEV